VLKVKINFDIQVTVHRDKILIIKPTTCTNFSIYFWNKTLHVSDSSSVHRQEIFTVDTAMVYVIHIPLLCVQWNPLTMDRGAVRNIVEFYSKNKFEKLVHLDGFITSKTQD